MSEDEIRQFTELFISERGQLELYVASALAAKMDLETAERLRNEAAEKMKVPARDITPVIARNAAKAEAKYRTALADYELAKGAVEKSTKSVDKMWESLVGVSQ